MRLLRAIPLLASVGCATSDAGVRWEGTMDTLPNGGVRVTNTARGIWDGDDAPRLAPVLTLGAVEGSGPDVFASISDIEVGDDGRIYVLDRQLNELRIFDSAGAHVGSVGRAGQGPGEFERANGLEWLPGGDSLLVSDGDGGRYSIFDRDGRFVRSVIRPMSSYGWVFQGGFSNGLLYERGLHRAVEDYERVLIGMRLADQAELADSVSFPDPPAPPVLPYSVQYATGGMSMMVPFAPQPSWDVADDGSLWWGFGSEYRILRLSMDGDTLREILGTSTPVPVTDAEVAEWAEGEGPKQFRERGGDLDLGRIPKQKPFFTDLWVDPDGKLWVETPTADGTSEFDVFDEQGRLLGRVATGIDRDPYVKPRMHEDRLYLVGTDELEVPHVYVFRIATGRIE